jgi:hypothetical protein
LTNGISNALTAATFGNGVEGFVDAAHWVVSGGSGAETSLICIYCWANHGSE